MTMGVGEVARVLSVTRDQLKSMAYHFREYLSSDANPQKGKPRNFSIEDVRVLAYIMYHWEDEPDFESIRRGLNTNGHFEDIYNDLIASITPVFQEPPEDIDETWEHGVMVGGMCNDYSDTYALADSYKRAGDLLVDAALKNYEVRELFCPVCFNYRHAIELYLKAASRPAAHSHDLSQLLTKFSDMLSRDYETIVPDWFLRFVLSVHEADPSSEAFRYGDVGLYRDSAEYGGEVWVDLLQLKCLMQWATDSFAKIRKAQGWEPSDYL